MTVDVYLDNQDLSRMFKPENSAQEEIKNELLRLKEERIARYVFSMWHVIEFIQKPAPGYEKQHRLKAQFLFNLCEYNALPFHEDISLLETRATSRAIWLPRSAVTKMTFDLRGSFKKAIDERDGLNRSQRRALKSTTAMRFVQKNAINTEKFIEQNFPITEKFRNEQTLTRFIRGEISEKEFAAGLAELFCSPPMFYDQWYNDSNRESILQQICDGMGDKLVKSIKEAKIALPALVDARRQLKDAQSKYHDAKRKLKELGLSPTLDETIFRNKPVLDPQVILEGIQVPKGFDYLKHYFWKVSKGASYKSNDAADLMHLFYTPHVDLMRCDAAMFEVMKDCASFDTRKLVPKFIQLPDRIKQAAAAAQC